MTKEEADLYVARALMRYIERACEEHEAILWHSREAANRIPQIAKAYEHLQAAEHLLNEAVVYLENKDSAGTDA